MGFIKIVPKECQCALPDASSYGIGTVWECDNPECKKRYRLTHDRNDLIWTNEYDPQTNAFRSAGR